MTRWDVAIANDAADLKARLEEGWEPFSAAIDPRGYPRYFLRRQVQAPKAKATPKGQS